MIPTVERRSQPQARRSYPGGNGIPDDDAVVAVIEFVQIGWQPLSTGAVVSTVQV